MLVGSSFIGGARPRDPAVGTSLMGMWLPGDQGRAGDGLDAHHPSEACSLVTRTRAHHFSEARGLGDPNAGTTASIRGTRPRDPDVDTSCDSGTWPHYAVTPVIGGMRP